MEDRLDSPSPNFATATKLITVNKIANVYGDYVG
jgi:hypothetical protein